MMNPVPWLQMTNMISYQGLVRTFLSKSYACLTPELVAQFGLKEDVAKNLQWSHDGKCLKPGQLEGMEIKADLSQSALVISLPQAYLEYTWPD